jgi:hypothetical protein
LRLRFDPARAYEYRDCSVDIGGHREDVIIAELHQCTILSIGLSDAADERRVNNDRLAGLQFGELMERDISTDLNSIEQVFDKLKERLQNQTRIQKTIYC